jgi:pseudouridine synthase
MAMVRLNKFLAECGVASRRKCDQLIGSGRVAVNGVVQQTLGTRIDVDADSVSVDNKPVNRKSVHSYIVLNKPAGYVTTSSDEYNRKTVMDLVRSKSRLFPVGRLDKESRGLLLMTDDGDLAYRLTHPKFHVPRVYQLRLNKPLQERDRRKLERGIALEEGMTAPCKISVRESQGSQSIQITLHQGWKRQIRRMFARVGYRVIFLKRTRMGPLHIGKLEEGLWRSLTRKEVEQLRKGTGAGYGN